MLSWSHTRTESMARSKQRAPRVLIVDDEESILGFAERVLHLAGYETRVAADGPEALRIAEDAGPFDLLLADLVMPGMRGDELARQLLSRDPDLKILYLTGYSDQLFNERAVLWESEAFVEKPVTVNGLLEAVSLMLFGHTRQGARGPFADMAYRQNARVATAPLQVSIGGAIGLAFGIVYIGLPSPARQWSVFREQMIRLDPKAEQGLDEQARDLRDATGLDLETDILGWMTGEVALAGFDITSGDMPFQAALVAEASDDGAADRAVEKILGYLRRFPTEEHTHGGASLTAVTVPGEEGVRPTLGRQGRFVLLATSPEAAMKALDAHADPAKSLVESAGYREMRSRLGSAQQGLLFADVERALREVQAAFREEIGQEPEVKQALDQARVLKAIGSGGHSLPNGATGTLYLAVDYDQLAAAIKELQRVFGRATQSAQRAECASHVRQLALATIMYASDYDDQLPPADNWVEALQPYFRNRDILRCPSAPGQPVAYAYNSLAAGQRLSDLPPDMVLFFETSKNESNPADDGTSVVARHPGGTNYAFVDGHVAASTAPPRFAP